MRWRQALLVAAVAFVAAVLGVVAARALAPPPEQAETELHALLHRELDLSEAQHDRLDALETRFARRRAAIEAEMRADNARLAQAIALEKGYGPRVTQAIDHSHMLMGELQKVTLEHVFAMRAELTPSQAEKFDRTVVEALTQPAR